MDLRSTSAINEFERLAILQHLDKEQLQALDDADVKLTDLINDDAQVKNFEQEKEMLITSNKSIAEYNLGFQPRIHQGRESLAYSYERVTKLKEEYDLLVSKIASQNDGPSLVTGYDMLRFAAQESEEKTDAKGEEFLEGDIECDNFLKSFIEARQQTHVLKIKAEKLGEMLHHGRPSGPSNPAVVEPTIIPSRPLPPLASQPGRPGYQAPYPMYGTGMPQASHYLPKM